MPKTRPPYSLEFRRPMVDAVLLDDLPTILPGNLGSGGPDCPGQVGGEDKLVPEFYYAAISFRYELHWPCVQPTRIVAAACHNGRSIAAAQLAAQACFARMQVDAFIWKNAGAVRSKHCPSGDRRHPR